MIEVGGKPILWHIMRYYAHFGFREFVVALGYKGEEIKRYFLEYRYMHSNITVRLHQGQEAAQVHGGSVEDWTIHLVDTGPTTETGGRLKRLTPWIGGEGFMMTYGDGLGAV